MGCGMRSQEASGEGEREREREREREKDEGPTFAHCMKICLHAFQKQKNSFGIFFSGCKGSNYRSGSNLHGKPPSLDLLLSVK